MRLLAVKWGLFSWPQTEEKRLLNKLLVHCPMSFCVAGSEWMEAVLSSVAVMVTGRTYIPRTYLLFQREHMDAFLSLNYYRLEPSTIRKKHRNGNWLHLPAIVWCASLASGIRSSRCRSSRYQTSCLANKALIQIKESNSYLCHEPWFMLSTTYRKHKPNVQ